MPGTLPLYIGMRLLVHSKDCVRLGIMNGAECILENLIPADEEEIEAVTTAGQPHQLKYMPTAMLLRAVDAAWTLPSSLLPPLPHTIDRRGLFLLRPATDFIKHSMRGEEKLHVRRTQFQVIPASTRVVYGAQGEGWDAASVDLARPPNMKKFIHWLACYVMLSRVRSLD